MSTPQSTGPVTPEANSQSAQNAITHGLFSEIHLVRTQDATEFEALTAQLRHELHPETALETTLFNEIARASWRLERCGRAEDAGLNDDNQPAIDGARSAALNIILKATAELRRLQTSRRIGYETFPEGTDLSDHGIANEKEIIAALANNERRLTIKSKLEHGDHLDDLFHQADRRITREYREKNPPAAATESEAVAAEPPATGSSFCKTPEAPANKPVPRNAPCPCGAKKKYKQCCGKNAPPVLHHGARPEPTKAA